MNNRVRRHSTITLLLVCAACAMPQTELPQVSPAAVAAEEALQRRLVIEELNIAQGRLDNVGFPLLVAATPLCGDQTTSSVGVRAATVQSFPEEYTDAVTAGLSLTDTLTVLGIADGSPAGGAGLVSGDRILRADGESIPVGRAAANAFSNLIAGSGSEPIELVADRDGSVLTLSVTPVTICDYDLVVTAEGDINAYADGERVIIPWAMMQFADEEELISIVGHEIAHNAMGHIDAQIQNMLLGGLLGAVLDVALADDDVDSDVSNTADFMAAAAEAYSQDFEREADYVGAYIVARAGHPLEGVPRIWRKFASISPDAISYASTHPSTAERFVRLTRIMEEIDAKIRAGEELLPELAPQ